MISSLGSGMANSLFDAPTQGMKRSLAEANGAAQKIAEGDISPDNFTALIQADISLKANRTVAVTADEMIGTLLDRKA
ncbi:MAG: hypothetical protein QM790_18250 [Nibricoccus sp.]